MSRYIEINECHQCQHRMLMLRNLTSVCLAMMHTPVPPSGVPDWCPLPVLPTKGDGDGKE